MLRVRTLLLLAVSTAVFAVLAGCNGTGEAETGNNGVGTTPSADTTLPSAPTGLTASAAGPSGANLSWNASTDNVGVTGYIVRRNGVQSGTPATTTYAETGLSPGVTYSYTVAARDAAGNVSPDSASVSVTTASAADTTPPTTPTGLTAAAAGSFGANLSWSASTDNVGVTGYIVRRNGTQVATPAATSFADTGLSAATTYSYTVAARDAAGNVSPDSASVSVTTGIVADTTPPTTPTGLTAAVAGSTGANLSWSASTDNVGVTGYIVRRNGVQIATPAATSFADTGLSVGTYSYTVAARDAAGNASANSATASITIADTTPPTTPTGLTAAVAGSSGANLSWSASTDNVGVTGYIVRRNGVQIATSATTSFADTGLSAATTYSYTVAARDAAGNVSPDSTSASVTTAIAPPPPPPTAGTFFVATAGSDLNSCATAQNGLTPKQTIQAGFACLSPGSTLTIRDGTYSGAANAFTGIPNGSAGNYITIQAENEGNVIITGGLVMAQGNQYIVFQGLRFQDSNQHPIYGNHLKFLRTEFRGGCLAGNCMNITIGTNDFTPGAQFVLLEDVWVHGFGGRYKVLVYNSDSIVLRRVITRFDGATSEMNGDPMADITVYDSSNVEVQNAIAIDGLPYSPNALDYTASFYNICNATTTTPSKNHSWRGSIAIKPTPTGFLMGTEGACDQVGQIVVDVAGSGGKHGISQLKGVNVLYTRITTLGSGEGGFGVFGGSATVQDSIAANHAQYGYKGLSVSNSVTWNNVDNSLGTLLNPFISGLLYLPRIEALSVLSLGGVTGGQRGAQIVKRIGAPGTLYGEAGYNTTTTTELWPFPNEARIKKEMCTDAGVTRGFCADTSLTHYIMNSLGNGSPY